MDMQICIPSEYTNSRTEEWKECSRKIQQRGLIYEFFKWLPVFQRTNGFYSRNYRFLFLLRRAFLSAKNDGTRKTISFQKYLSACKKMAKAGIIVRSTPLFSCPFHILSPGKKESTKHNKNAALPSSSSPSFLWFVIVRFLLGHFVFVKRHLTVLYSAVLLNFRLLCCFVGTFFCVARAFNNCTLSTRTNACA